MKISGIGKNREIMDIYFTLASCNKILKLFALNCISRNGSQFKSSWYLWKTIIVVSVFLTIVTAFAVCKIQIYNFTKFDAANIHMNIIQWTFILGSVVYLTDLTYVYKFGTNACIEYYTMYKNIDNVINMKYFVQIKACVIRFTIFLSGISMLSAICDYIAWSLYNDDWTVSLLYFSEYISLFMRMLTILDAICHIIQIEYRLRMICELLQDWYESALYHYMPSMTYKDVATRMTIQEYQEHERHFKMITNNHNNIVWLTRSYLLLTEQAEYINTMYGFRMLLHLLVMLIDMINSFYLFFIIIIQSVTMHSKYYPAITSFMRLITFAAILVSLVHRCERCYRQDDRIIDIIDHLQINKKISADLHGALTELRTLVCARRIHFHAANFFRLEYSLLLTISAVVITYTIILLQNIL